ncbi:hypothetical protein ES703_30343 [subsurface metagenome]
MGYGRVAMELKRFDVYLVNLDPTVGKEIKKTRPCLVVSPDEMNRHIATVIVAPMTTKGRQYPTRVSCQFQGKHGQIAGQGGHTGPPLRCCIGVFIVNLPVGRIVSDVLAKVV